MADSFHFKRLLCHICWTAQTMLNGRLKEDITHGYQIFSWFWPSAEPRVIFSNDFTDTCWPAVRNDGHDSQHGQIFVLGDKKRGKTEQSVSGVRQWISSEILLCFFYLFSFLKACATDTHTQLWKSALLRCHQGDWWVTIYPTRCCFCSLKPPWICLSKHTKGTAKHNI